MDAVPAPGRHTPSRRVAVVGFGTVGRAVAKILGERNAGDGLLRLTHICNRDIERKNSHGSPSAGFRAT